MARRHASSIGALEPARSLRSLCPMAIVPSGKHLQPLLDFFVPPKIGMGVACIMFVSPGLVWEGPIHVLIIIA